ncbi:predicted protein [Postia placenta Mad-698-R]|uniref:Uncharacterized protein n=1 Tax=Postia placenta MAD-698-R-SB12 TaxID=670580 RepID=A0A1X6MRZ8_9APHY|nr:hypothetical protein POSPLADRAFT_1049132 [Postia placenta MAD-698-R-SB12]EED80001.1 predicted protein [Postia placenta Mad-698-R]OSX58982.1 hypothetical protein POSPLADRAFT_1049132 [Postia placenta MAD-698-R-SB12]
MSILYSIQAGASAPYSIKRPDHIEPLYIRLTVAASTAMIPLADLAYLYSPKYLAALLAFIIVPDITSRTAGIICAASQFPELVFLVLGPSLTSKFKLGLTDFLAALVLLETKLRALTWLIKLQKRHTSWQYNWIADACLVIEVLFALTFITAGRRYMTSTFGNESEKPAFPEADNAHEQPPTQMTDHVSRQGTNQVAAQNGNQVASRPSELTPESVSLSTATVVALQLPRRATCPSSECTLRQSALMRLFKEYFETMKRNTNCLRENLRLSEEALQLRREMREVDEEMTQLKANCLEAVKGTKELAYELSQENKALRDLLGFYQCKIEELQDIKSQALISRDPEPERYPSFISLS